MLAYRTVLARHKDLEGSGFRSSRSKAPRAAWICRLGSPPSIGFALLYLMLVGILPAVGTVSSFAGQPSFESEFLSKLDHDG